MSGASDDYSLAGALNALRLAVVENGQSLSPAQYDEWRQRVCGDGGASTGGDAS